jgi:hypothetical protein
MNSTIICDRLRDPSTGLPAFAFIIGPRLFAHFRACPEPCGSGLAREGGSPFNIDIG